MTKYYRREREKERIEELYYITQIRGCCYTYEKPTNPRQQPKFNEFLQSAKFQKFNPHLYQEYITIKSRTSVRVNSLDYSPIILIEFIAHRYPLLLHHQDSKFGYVTLQLSHHQSWDHK